MNAAKLFKSFTPYRQKQPGKPVHPYQEMLEAFEVQEPGSTQWSSGGFTEVTQGELTLDVQGAGTLAMYQINERVLPGSVIKEKIIARLREIEDRDGRKAGKKQFAEVREDVTMALLPNAFIRRKFIPVLFRNNMIYMFTGSAKVCDTISTALVIAMPAGFDIEHIGSAVEASIGGALTTLAKEDDLHGDEEQFWTSNSIVLTGGDKQVIRIKDKTVGSHDVQELLKQEYQVRQLGIAFGSQHLTEEEATFVMSDKFIFTSLKLEGSKDVGGTDAKDAADILISTAWLTANVISRLVGLAVDMCGGYRVDDAPSKPSVDVSDL